MARHVFKGHVIHSGKHFQKGQECPAELHERMLKADLLEALPEPVPAAPEKKEGHKAK